MTAASRWRRAPLRAGLWLLLPLALAACGGGKKDNPVGASDADLAFLNAHNARFNDGRTVRWPGLPIRVFANGIAREDEVTEWTRASGGRVTFVFVGGASGADITFRFGSGADVCGVTNVRFTTDGAIVSADVQVVQAIFRGPQCQRTVVHEVGHAIGFLDHSSDGGLMDPEGGDGRITQPVADMISLLYALPPGSVVGALVPGRLPQRLAGGLRGVTIVDPVRR